MALRGAALSMKSSIFSETSKIDAMIINKVKIKKKVPKNFFMMYRSSFLNMLKVAD
jgi:hypothetical protein